MLWYSRLTGIQGTASSRGRSRCKHPAETSAERERVLSAVERYGVLFALSPGANDAPVQTPAPPASSQPWVEQQGVGHKQSHADVDPRSLRHQPDPTDPLETGERT